MNEFEHINEFDISDYIEDNIDESTKARYAEHIAQCSLCKEAVEKSKKVVFALKDYGQPSEAFKSNLLKAMKKESTAAKGSFEKKGFFKNSYDNPLFKKRLWLAVGSIAAVLVLAFFIRVQLFNNFDNEMASSNAIALGSDMINDVQIAVSIDGYSYDSVVAEIKDLINDIDGKILKESATDSRLTVDIASDILPYFNAKLIDKYGAIVEEIEQTASSSIIVNISFNL